MAINRTVVIMGIAAAGAALLRAWERRRGPDVLVIGEELAAARSADRLHAQSRDPARSPLPAQRYDPQPAGDFEWLDPQPLPLDSALAQAVRRYAAGDAVERARMRDAIGMDGFSELLTFASRAALFALRERSAGHVRDGLAAVAMMEPARMDPRDISMAAAQLHHAAVRVGADAGALFREAGALAEPGVGGLLTGFPARPAREKDLRLAWLLEEVQLPGGPIFLQRGMDAYRPTRDLVPVMLDVARVLAADQYRPGPPSIAYSLPPAWLESADSRALRRANGRIRAGAKLSASLRPGVHAGEPQMPMLVFVEEMASDEDARTLLDASRRVRSRPGVAMLGVAEGPYFALVVAGSFTREVEPYETAERLSRFAAPLGAVLRRHAG